MWGLSLTTARQWAIYKVADDPISTHYDMDMVPNLQDITDSIFRIPRRGHQRAEVS